MKTALFILPLTNPVKSEYQLCASPLSGRYWSPIKETESQRISGKCMMADLKVVFIHSSCDTTSQRRELDLKHYPPSLLSGRPSQRSPPCPAIPARWERKTRRIYHGAVISSFTFISCSPLHWPAVFQHNFPFARIYEMPPSPPCFWVKTDAYYQGRCGEQIGPLPPSLA